MSVTQSWQKCQNRGIQRPAGARSGAVIAVSGELDAANADQLADYVQGCVTHCRG